MGHAKLSNHVHVLMPSRSRIPNIHIFVIEVNIISTTVTMKLSFFYPLLQPPARSRERKTKKPVGSSGLCLIRTHDPSLII